MDNIPPEIWTQILACLPVKSLLRFRAASRIWKSIIEQPYFTSLHLQCCHTNVLDASIIVKQSKINRSNGEYKWVVRCSETFEERSTHIKFPVECEGEDDEKWYWQWDCVCARDGLLLLQKHYDYSWKPGDVKLWNPSIGKSIDIDPPSPSVLLPWHSKYEAFLGFDPSSNDYKVVAIPTGLVKGLYKPYIYVYSLKDRLWDEVRCNSAAGCKYICDRNYKICHSTNYQPKVSVGVYIHWIDVIDTMSDVYMVSLNLTTLTISVTPFLDDHLWKLRGPVCGCSYLGLLVEGFHKSGVKWSKMKEMTDELKYGYYHIRKDGRILVLTHELALFMYDLNTGKKSKVVHCFDVSPHYINTHIESLVLLNS